ncbi:MAG: ABC transporter ATP-binding protein [Candidatus Methanomethylicia archaeon]|nr:ABC transporter ATP-binding protein [Candidatus Methanomethylicia archaeon]MCX8168909.1 ABC transporter ATP-binding protein [Candidatus Methanomethylicia archaeon]MDW7988641.1 ABC transporter ATP-binding protein [Nitrososphaerota archaeon]
MAPNPIVEIKDLHFAYPGGRKVLHGINMTVNEGEIVAILGPNASGKTTLLKIIAKVITTSFIDIQVCGKSIKNFDYKDYARLVAYVPQEETITLPFTVYEYILLGRTPHINLLFIDRKDHSIVESVINLLGIEHLKDRRVYELSGGEKQLVRIGRALVQEPRIILLDEPTSHLDLKNKVGVLKLMREVSSNGITIIFTTHDPNEALIVSDRVYLINEGKVIVSGPSSEILSKDVIKNVYKVDVMYMKNEYATAILPIIK